MPAGDWDGLERLDATALQNRLYDNLRALMAGKDSAEAEDAALAALPEPLRAYWHLSRLDFEVALGGLGAYFMNSAGRHAGEAAGALRAIGAPALADVVEEAQRVAGRDLYGEAGRDELDDLDDRYRELYEGWDLDAYFEARLPEILAWAGKG